MPNSCQIPLYPSVPRFQLFPRVSAGQSTFFQISDGCRIHFRTQYRPPYWPYYNPKAQARALQSLLQKLPDLDAPVRQAPDRPKPRRGHRLNEEQVQRLIKGYEAGATVYELGERFRVERRTVSKILKRHGVRMRRQGLTPEQVEEAVLLYEAAWSLERIGARMKVDSTTVRRRLRERGVMMRDSRRPKP